MANPVYSRLLAYFTALTPTTLSYPVPGSFVWVVRDIEARCGEGASWRALNGLDVTALFGGPIYHIYPFEANSNQLYSWRGRQILGTGDELIIQSLDNDWEVRVSGYELSLP